eukprot:m.156308 g.156308  ORF g.156308 m.156308 type:complete len:251 (-) comp14320_c1_seq1:603-1355(-)
MLATKVGGQEAGTKPFILETKLASTSVLPHLIMKIAVLCLVASMLATAAARSCDNRNTCQNGAQCIRTYADPTDLNSKQSFKCICAAGYSGDRCEYLESPQNWVREGECEYMFVSSPVATYGDAARACELAGGNLAQVSSAAVDAKINLIVPDGKQGVGRWIGLKRAKPHLGFKWERDNTMLERTSYQNWLPRQPAVNEELCTIQDIQNGVLGWATHLCKDKKRYVCQRCDSAITAKKSKTRRRRRRKNN